MRITPSPSPSTRNEASTPEAVAQSILRKVDEKSLAAPAIAILVDGNPQSPAVNAILFRVLAGRFAKAQDDFHERWALRRFMEAMARLAMDQGSSLPQPALAPAAPAPVVVSAEPSKPETWLDAVLRHHGAGQAREAFAAFARGLSETAARKDAGVLTELETAARLLLEGSFGRDQAAAVAACREGLRGFLRAWFTDSRGPTGFNLIVVDADVAARNKSALGGPLAAFDAFLDHRPKSLPEDFSAEESSLLWIAGNRAAFITLEDSWSKPAVPSILALGRLCAQYPFPEDGAAAAPAGDWRPAVRYDAASVKDRECRVIGQLPLFAHAMRYLTNKAEFTDPAKFMGTVRMLVQHAEEYRRNDDNRKDTWTPLVDAHCATNAYVNDFLHALTRLYNPPYPLPGTRGVLGDMRGEALDKVVAQLDEKGYFKFDTLVPEELRRGLMRHAREDECIIYGDGLPAGLRGRYDGRDPKGSKYQLDADISLKTPEFQALLADHSILSVTQAYLASRVTMETCAMWWLPLYGRAPSFAAAQQFHFDMDRWKWLNWFLYLTDVDTGTAPHTIVQKSHKRLAKPNEILSRGYVRVDDAELGRHYPAGDFLELTGKAGTLMAVDTRVWHKAKFPTTGERLILEIVCCTSMFGNDSLKRGPKLPAKPIPDLARLVDAYPQLYAQYL